MAKEVDILLKLRGARAFNKEAATSGKTVGAMQKRTDRLSKSMRGANKHIGLFRGALRGVIGLGAGFLAWRGLESAVGGMESLAENTLRLHRTLRMSIPEASRWAGILQARNLDPRSLTMSYRALSGQITSAAEGSKGSQKNFDLLGLSWTRLIGLSPHKQIMAVSDALNRMPNSTVRAAVGAKLFGRGWASLGILLGAGSKQMEDQLKLADKYGVTLHGHTVKSLEEFMQAQRENKLAMLGLQTQLAQGLIPWITRGIDWLNKFIGQFRTSTGEGGKVRHMLGQVADVIQRVWDRVRPLFTFLGNNPKLASYLIVGAGTIGALSRAHGLLGGKGGILPSMLGLSRLGPLALTVGVSVVFIGAAGNWLAKKLGLTKVSGHHGGDYSNLLGLPIGSGSAADDIVKGRNPYPIGTGVWDAWKAGSLGRSLASLHEGMGSQMRAAWSRGFAHVLHGGHPEHHHRQHRALGGPVAAGRAYIVGEKGPELATFPSSGNITSHGDLMRMIRELAGRPLRVTVQSVLDGKVIAESTARVVSDRAARA